MKKKFSKSFRSKGFTFSKNAPHSCPTGSRVPLLGEVHHEQVFEQVFLGELTPRHLLPKLCAGFSPLVWRWARRAHAAVTVAAAAAAAVSSVQGTTVAAAAAAAVIRWRRFVVSFVVSLPSVGGIELLFDL